MDSPAVHTFTWAETLNAQADHLATDARRDTISSDHQHWPEQAVSVIGPTGRLTGRLGPELRYCCTAPDLVSYWQSRYGWSAVQARMVDVLGTKGVAAKLRPASVWRIQKLRCGWLPVNNRVARHDPDRLPRCSACSPPGWSRRRLITFFSHISSPF